MPLAAAAAAAAAAVLCGRLGRGGGEGQLRLRLRLRPTLSPRETFLGGSVGGSKWVGGVRKEVCRFDGSFFCVFLAKRERERGEGWGGGGGQEGPAVLWGDGRGTKKGKGKRKGANNARK